MIGRWDYMVINFIEEPRAQLNGFEVPIECIQRIHKSTEKLRIHYHDYIEFLFGENNCNIELWCNGRTYHISEGELLLIPSRVPHIVKTCNETSKYIVIKIMPQILYAAEQSIFEIKYLMPFIADEISYKKKITKDELDKTDIPDTINHMICEWNTKKYGFEIALRIGASKLMLWFLRKWHVLFDDSKSEIFPSVNTTLKIQKIIEYTNNNYDTITVKHAADMCNMSYSHFSKTFKKVTNKGFKEYVTHIRITESERLLVSTNKSITEIAMETGFSTTSHFIECFKKQLHITPKQYKKNFTNSK